MTIRMIAIAAVFAVTAAAVIQCSSDSEQRPQAGSRQAKAADFKQLLARAGQSDLFSVETNLKVTEEGLARTQDGSARLFGSIRGQWIESILVNGEKATLDRVKDSWHYNIDRGSRMLNSGVNRVLVQAYGENGAKTVLLGQNFIDIYFDTGSWVEKAGRIEPGGLTNVWNILRSHFFGEPSLEVYWTAADSPYHVTSDVVVAEFTRLIIEPGVTVFFDEGTQLVVNGELVAAGTDFKRIHMRSTPGLPFVADIRPELKPGPARWRGIQIRDSVHAGNLIAKTDIAYAQSSVGSIGAHRSRLRIDDVRITGTHEFMIFSDESSLIVENCIFDDMFSDEEHPMLMTPPVDNTAEFIKGLARVRFPKDGYYIIRNNYFGTNKGHNDVIDVDSNRYPHAVLQIKNNFFAGGGDEAIDGGGDMLIEGNIFQNFVKEIDNDDNGDSNVISTGEDTRNDIVVITRNVFLNVDHVVNLKKGAFSYFENNTVVGITQPHWAHVNDPPRRMLEFSVINLLIPNRKDPKVLPPRHPAGQGAYTAGNIYVDIPENVFGHPDLNPIENDIKSRLKWWLRSMRKTSILHLQTSLVESAAVLENSDLQHGRNFDYELGVPEFESPSGLDFTLRPGSPGHKSGPNGLDMGAAVPAGASISGEPDGVTTADSVKLLIGGPGIFSFMYKVNEGSWSKEIFIGDPRDYRKSSISRTKKLELDGLAAGRYTVYVRGRNFAGELQPESNPTKSKSWLVEFPGN